MKKNVKAKGLSIQYFKKVLNLKLNKFKTTNGFS